MKKIFLVIAVAAFSFASAQVNNTPWVKPMKLKSKIKIPEWPKMGLPFQQPKINLLNQLYQPQQLIANSNPPYTLPNGNKVYSLPLDHMPCVVPDMSQYNSMPVLKPDMKEYNMPNATNPPKSKIESVSPDKLKEFQDLLNKLNK